MRREPSERAIRIHQLIKTGCYPNCRTLGRELEVSTRTIKRDLEFMRDHYDLPVGFCARRNGYYYTKPGVELPLLANISRREACALLLAQLSLGQYPGMPFAEAAGSGFRKVSWRLGSCEQLHLEGLEHAISFNAFGVEEANPQTLECVTAAVRGSYAMGFLYRKPGHKTPEPRTVHPYALALRDNAWYVIGYDPARKAVRTFALLRMSATQLLREKFKPPVEFKLDVYFAGSMGVMRGTGDYEVILEFDAWATDLIKHRRWHPSQRLHLLGSGSRLTLRLNNLEEVHRWALSWGQHVTVIAPDLLRARMLESAQALIERYGDPERPRVIEPMFSLADTPRFGVS